MAGGASDWVLATVARHEPEEHGANVTIEVTRSMTVDEVKAVRSALNLVGYVSAYALNEPLRRMADELGGFIHSIITADKPPEVLTTHTDATLAFDNFLNQLPLFWGRVLRNMRLFVGEHESQALRDSFTAEFEKTTPWRLLWELRNACQHTMLPTDVVELASTRREDGQRVLHWAVSLDTWRALDKKFPKVLQFLPSPMGFWPLITDVIRFCDERVAQCFLVAGDQLDDAALLVLKLVGEAVSSTSAKSVGVTVLRYGGTAERRMLDQMPLNHVQCGEVLLHTDQAREAAGLPRLRPKISPGERP